MSGAQPLAGRGVVITRPAGQAQALASLVAARGGTPILFPTIAIEAVEDRVALDAVIDRLGTFDLAIFVSPNAVEKGLEAVRARGVLPPHVQIAAVGRGSARALRASGVAEVIAPGAGDDSESLLAMPALDAVRDKRIVIFRGVGGRELLRQTLEARGAQVEYAECYRRAIPQLSDDVLAAAWARGALRAWVATSSEGLHNLVEMLGPDWRERLARTPVFVTHPRIAETARALEMREVVVAASGDEDIVEALCAHFGAAGEGARVAVHSPSPHTVAPAMNDTPEQKPAGLSAPPSAVEPAPEAAAPRTRGSLVGAVALLVAVLALLLLAWQWYASRATVEALRQDVAKKLAEGEAVSRESKLFAGEAREASADAQVKLGVLESRVAESQSQQIALETLYQQLSRNRDEWAFADIEQSLLIASQQLQLAGNVKAALIALQNADARMQHMERPQLTALRKAIHRDLERLKALPYIDTIGLSVRLDTVMAAVDTLPLAMEVRPPASSDGAEPSAAPGVASAWQRFVSEAWDELKALVRVQHMTRAEVPLLTPTQSFFLRENLKLRLLGARLALLARDQPSYKADLKAAREWIIKYYDTREKSVVTALNTLRNLHESEISIEVPEIAGTLDALRNLRIVREQTVR